MDTLGATVAGFDAARFVNRAAELARLEELLGGERRVILVHGPGGVGKSTLLRELARRAAARGFAVRWVEGGELSPGADALEDALAGVREQRRPLVVIDTFERIAALGGYLRRALLPALGPEARVVIASRTPPTPQWYEGGWDRTVAELALRGLSDRHAREVLARSGVDSEASARRIIRWARGSPLALTLAADAHQRGAGWSAQAERGEVMRALVARLADPEIDRDHGSTLAVAAIARVTTVELLRATLPDVDAREELRWLAARTFAEPLGEGIALHELVAEAVREELVRTDPLRERELRRRICDHLYERARRGGGLRLAIELSHLTRSPAVRWGFAWQPPTRLRLDEVRRGDLELIRARLRGSWHERLLAGTERFIEQTPEHVVCVRDAREQLRGYTIALTPSQAPDFAGEDPLLGPRLAHARALAEPWQAVLWRDVVDLGAEPDREVISMLGIAGVLRAAPANPRYAYLPINRRLPGALAFSRALAGRHLRELDLTLGGVRIECHLLDYGPGGLLGAQRDLIYRELGLTPPESADPHGRLTAAVRQALRDIDRPHALAASELATGATLEERARSVRALLEEAADRAFDPGAADQLTRRALMLGYLEPAPSHELAAAQLSLSRSAYFRRLQRAAERLADYIAAKRA